MKEININNLAQIENASISFGDLTVFVGPQASGKSILLQLIKLLLDHNSILRTIKQHGFDWQQDPEKFASLYFGEGMQNTWDQETKVIIDGKPFNLANTIEQRGKKRSEEQLFLIPAQRVITLKNGWPRAFTDYETGDPYVVKQFSERLRLLMEAGLGAGKSAIFPQEGRMNKEFRNAVNRGIFSNAEVRLDTSSMRKRIILRIKNQELPFMVWSAGQREFIPLLLGLYWLMPSAGASKSKNINWVVVEEPEMGLHPEAISSLLNVLLELIHRGYKVILSTHSPQILELIWAIQILGKYNANSDFLLQILNLRKVSYLNKFADDILTKVFKAYYFERNPRGNISVKDISSLDAEDLDIAISDWGGLTHFSSQVSSILSQVIQDSVK